MGKRRNAIDNLADPQGARDAEVARLSQLSEAQVLQEDFSKIPKFIRKDPRIQQLQYAVVPELQTVSTFLQQVAEQKRRTPGRAQSLLGEFQQTPNTLLTLR